MDSAAEEEEAGADGISRLQAAEWFKQRVACELLGDPLTAPWDIDEDHLYARLSVLFADASGCPGSSASAQREASESG